MPQISVSLVPSQSSSSIPDTISSQDTHHSLRCAFVFILQGIYPTILIVLVKFGKTNFENDFAYTEEPQVITTRARARNSANMNTENRKSGPYMLSRPVSFPPPSPLGSGWTVVTESKYEGERRASLHGVEKVEEV